MSMPTFAQAKDWLIETWQDWNKDEAPRMGAALSFYTMLSLAPLLILLIALAGIMFGDEAASNQLFGQIRDLVGDQGASVLQEMVKNANKPGKGIVASLIGFVTLIVGASTVASELQYALNRIWSHHLPEDESGMTDQVKKRGIALGIVLAAGFLLLTSLAVSTTLAAAGT
jgi:membrane protein